MEPVTSVLIERAHDVQGLPRMVTVSLVAHGALIAVLLLFPVLGPPRSAQDLQPVMTISLGGVPGPRAGGMTMMSRPSQGIATLPEPVKPANVIMPPTAKPPAMVLPERATKPVKPTPRPPTRPTIEAPPSAAITPPRVPFGGDAAQTSPNPNRGLGFGGLSTGGGAGQGGYLDVANFCCPDYLVTMVQLVQGNWNARQEVAGETLVKFRVLRDGRLTEIELERSSGYAALDLTAQRALFLTQRLPPLPSAFPEDHLTVHLRFPYQR
ncbi:MAG: TonB family protein [Acidobacteria bacterium]|nr:TonB family protein [Acidobacteriota bacterium]